jgi:serine protease Do
VAPVTAASRPTSSPSVSPTESAPPNFAQTYKEVSPGVVRIDVQGCESSGSGTGFLIGDNLVVTVAHVVSEMSTVRLTQETRSTSGTVIGLDETQDVALIRTSSPLEGHVLAFDPEGPVVGERVGVIGFPAGDSGLLDSSAGSKSFKEGSVNGLNRKDNIEGQVRTRLVELDALARGGNSGSPVLRPNGEVVGLLSAGPAKDDTSGARFAVNSQVAVPLIEQWKDAGTAVEPTDCSAIAGPDGQPVPFEELPGGDSAEVVATLNLYFDSINQADYSTAYAQMHPDVQDPGTAAAFAKGVESSQDTEIDYRSLRRSGRDLVVWTTFRSEQDATLGPDGLTCADWSLDYTLRQSDGLWLIVTTANHGDLPRFQACEAGQ